MSRSDTPQGFRNRRPTLAVCAILAACLSLFSAGANPLPPSKHAVAVIAHRGGAGLGPENTLAAYRKAIDLNVDYIEIDVRATRDGGLVLLHDGKLDRTTNGKGEVAQMDLSAVRSFDAGVKFSPEYAGEKVPTLDEAFQLFQGRVNAYLDRKEGSIQEIVNCIRKFKMEKQVVVYDGVEECMEWKRLAPDIAVMPGLPDEYQRPGGIADFKKKVSVEALDGDLGSWTQELVDQAHAQDIKVYVDCLSLFDQEKAWRKAVEIGVDGIQTDHPDKLLECLDKKQAP